MTPEDQIRMLMREQDLGGATGPDPELDPVGYAAMLEAERRRQLYGGYMRKETAAERAARGTPEMMPPEYYDTYTPPKTMEYREGMYGPGPYLQKGPHKGQTSPRIKNEYLKKL